MLPNQFPPSQCSSYFTQWLISEYLSRINESKEQQGQGQQQQGGDTLHPPATSSPPPKTPPPTPTAATPQHHGGFTAKHLKHLFTHATSKHHGYSSSSSSSTSSSSSASHANNKPNNNEYKNGLSSSSSAVGNDIANNTSPKNIEFIQLLALNALEFTAPIYSFLNKKQQSTSAVATGKDGGSGGSQKTVAAGHPIGERGGAVKVGASNAAPAGASTTQGEGSSKPAACRCPSTRSFVQLSGHPGSFAPAGPKTVWKKMPEDQGGAVCGRDQMAGKSLRILLDGLNINGGPSSSMSPPLSPVSPSPDARSPLAVLPPASPDTTPITVFFSDNTNSSTTSSSSSSSSSTPPLLPPQIFSIPTHLLPNETQVYRKVNCTSPPDTLIRIIPKYVTETCYCSQMFLELEDLLTNFSCSNPTIMDIKLGTRTFLESEVSNNKPRPDLYQKLISVDPSACTDEQHQIKAVTKLTYMLFREKQSSSTSLGFRVEGVKIGEGGKYHPEDQVNVNFKVLKLESEINDVILRFCKRKPLLAKRFVERLEFIREMLEQSEFFLTHEVIGSSLLFIHDDHNVGVWLIDFAKTFPVPSRLTHRKPWELGNLEDGVLTGVDSTIRLFQNVVAQLTTTTR